MPSSINLRRRYSEIIGLGSHSLRQLVFDVSKVWNPIPVRIAFGMIVDFADRDEK
jgi:hypothetical protein